MWRAAANSPDSDSITIIRIVKSVSGSIVVWGRGELWLLDGVVWVCGWEGRWVDDEEAEE